MRRNCNLELRLHHPSAADSGSLHHLPHRHRRHGPMQESGAGTPHQPQHLTIFYNGTMCVCDVTELQARAILFVASRSEMEERIKTPLTLSPSTESGFGLEPCSPSTTLQSQSPLCSPVAAGLSMKRSLQRFLQKRKYRIQATSPYNFH